jgi:tetratricopeptide (TPR) repeat protein
VESYQRAYRAQPDYGDAYWSLANLKTYRFSESELAQMVEQEASLSIITENRFHLCFALGKAYEDLGDYARSFAYYDKGNALKRAESGYRSEIVEQELKAQKALFDGDFFEERSGFGHANEAPIFILGLPRAGSTLLEQILASHSLVDGTMELANIIGTANRLNGQKRRTGTSPYPKVLAQLSEAQTRQLGEQFIQETEHHRGDGIYFIDKMPNNFRHIPLIQLILPKAKIIDARRHPMACCFSGFKQLFAEGQEFTYGLDEIGRYYRAYVDVMAHWERELPGRILRVQHEDVVEDLESQVRRILDYCGLPFEQACLDFHETERAVRTPSAEQVRQPIYKSGMEQWQHFGAYLGPLEDALGPTLSDYR